MGPKGTRTFTLPNTSSELAILAGTQTFTGNKTFSGALTVSGTLTSSGAAATIGTAVATATYGMGTGATTTGLTKTVMVRDRFALRLVGGYILGRVQLGRHRRDGNLDRFQRQLQLFGGL